MSASTPITVLLVHGSWHAPWCWKYQTPELQKIGYDVETIHLPCTHGVAGTTQMDDVNAIRSLLETLLSAGKRVVILAHSLGGPISSSAIIGFSEPERASKNLPGGVVGLICLSSAIIRGGTLQVDMMKAIGGMPYVSWNTPSEGLFMPNNVQELLLTPDVPQDRGDWAVPQLLPHSMATSTDIVPPQAWQEDADHYVNRLAYIVCGADNIFRREVQHAMVDGAGGKDKWIVREIPGSGHSPFLSRPEELASVVHEITEQFQKSTGSE